MADTTTKLTTDEQVHELSRRVIWALKYLRTRSGMGVVMIKEDDQKFKTQPWEDWFMDALEQSGYEVDRSAYYASRDGKKGKRNG